ncbi:hypothetical protein O3P69_004692 [Scylla paramamosain]|uniref:Uncharacterized protein n=1 Tax=Scylla paramamosain TaxID=85552 RepID=A0AAW0UG60_SCYPA
MAGLLNSRFTGEDDTVVGTRHLEMLRLLMSTAPSVNFCGYTIIRDGISADPNNVAAIREFPKPANLTNLRSFMGLNNQQAEFISDIAAVVQSLHSFTWTQAHQRSSADTTCFGAF